MKTFIVKIQRSHESFGGYDHIDGTEQYEVKASNDKTARNKALKQARKSGGGYEHRVIGIFNLTNNKK